MIPSTGYIARRRIQRAYYETLTGTQHRAEPVLEGQVALFDHEKEHLP